MSSTTYSFALDNGYTPYISPDQTINSISTLNVNNKDRTSSTNNSLKDVSNPGLTAFLLALAASAIYLPSTV